MTALPEQLASRRTILNSVAHLAERSPVHPFFYAGRWLAADLFSTLLFVGLFALTHSIYFATVLAIAAGALQIGYCRIRSRPVDVMQWMSLGLVLVFGAASLITHDPRFVMLKPTFIYIVVGGVMLRPGWMTRYMPPSTIEWSRDAMMAFSYAWSGLMFLTAALNLLLVANGDTNLWAWFIGVFPIASKLVLFAVQYCTIRSLVISRRGKTAALTGS